MANENNQSVTLSEGIVILEKCLDTLLSEQRKAAHNAIDMDDWSKAEEIIAKAKKSILGIESLKAKFAEFKAEAVKMELISDASAEQPKPAEAEPAEQPKPAEAKPAEQPKAAEAKPAEQPKAAEAKPAEQPKAAEAKPAEQPKAAEAKPAEQPKAAEAKPAEQPKAAEAKPAEQPKPVEAKPAEQPKPAAPAPKAEERPHNEPRTQANNDILDMEMSDLEPAPKPKNPVIDTCEELITKFPFSMKLICSNSKFTRFFTADSAAAKKNMSKPVLLTNGLWVESDIPEERVQTFIRGMLRYCEESMNM